MTFHLLAYGLVLALLLGGAAHWLERALRSLGWASRWVWAVALGTAATAPFLAPLLPGDPPPPSQSGLSLDVLYSLQSVGSATSSVSRSLVAALDRPLLWLWLGVSACVAALFLWVSLRLLRGSRRWRARRVAEERVLISDGLGPAVLGLFRPRIVLPPWVLDLDPEEMAMILVHESEHRRAKDPAILASGIVATVLCPLNPLLWWMLRRLRLAVEADCDARVLKRGVPGRRYAKLLLDVAEGSRSVTSLAPALVEGGRNSLERRLDMMRWSVRKNRVGVALGATLLGGFFIFLACETPTPPAASSGEDAVQGGQVVPDASADTGLPSGGVLRIRETGGAQGPSPLVEVDGVLVTGGNALSEIKADDIESIQVLKGSAALEQYGARGENGVIQIRLKEVGTPVPEATNRLDEVPEPTAYPQRELTVTADTVKVISEDGTLQGEQMTLQPGVLLRNQDPNAPAPLYIIDGVIVTDPAVVESLNPDDIDRIEVVKGGAAQAIWGERAANGVVQITTKK